MTAAPIRVSVFIQCYNAAPYLAECIESVLALQNPAPVEIIVIDDASTDGSAAIARRYADPRIQLIVHEKNKGAAATLNEGIDRCGSEWIARIDADDRYRSAFLSHAESAIRANPSAVAVYGRIAMMDARGQITSTERSSALPITSHCGDRFIDLLQDNFLSAPTLLAKADAWRRALPVPLDMQFCDWYCALRIAESGTLAYTDEIHADYRVHDQGMHVQMMREGWGEKIYWRVLDAFFAEPNRIDEKNRVRNKIYGLWAERIADSYFGFGRMRDARRCYFKAIWLNPMGKRRLRVMRLWLATWLSPGAYAQIKRVIAG